MLLDLSRSFNRLRSALAWPRPSLPPAPAPDCLCPLKQPDHPLPAWVDNDPLVHKYRELLGSLPWADFPERATDRPWPGPDPDPRAPFVAAFLIKLHESKRHMSSLRAFLIEHPALVYWLGFERVLDPSAPFGFDVAETVPKRRHFSTVLRTLSNDSLQFLLTASVHLLRQTLSPQQQLSFGEIIAGDTQAILAWVAENNPKRWRQARQTQLCRGWAAAVCGQSGDELAVYLPASRRPGAAHTRQVPLPAVVSEPDWPGLPDR